ncbi:MAG TPA: DUF805 domain-containing protein [Acidimicrobiaceae bacterium]|nr:DUF805 domain-containing protein [Acidimicrobiaceae bacterium]MAP97616.1 DUF805 domain-containing protein [Acidimicrobiaceae bacterium]HAA66799.1 DUF805 domain-containing protein [Acidimicrobiaceae bacterium]HAY64904.1 DUF805 domain-containing protein [Acidimicrobiaceae bacterium]HBV25550.1 DUF805 domain-containing protein [Acidimicrobiaceae bacterium]
MHYYFDSWRQYTDFQSRSSRPAYWWPALISFIVSFILGGISASIWDINSNQAGPLEIIYFLAYLCPSIALGVRRLHDIGRSGKWMWLMLTVVGVIPLLYWWVQPSSNEANEWGPPATAIS